MSNGLPASFWEVVCTFYVRSQCSLRGSHYWKTWWKKKKKKKPVCILEGWKGKLMILWLMIKGGWVWVQRGVKGRRVGRWARDASFPWHLYSEKWLRGDWGVPCLAHCSFPRQFSLPSTPSKLFLWQLLSLSQKHRNQTGSSPFHAVK